MSFHVFSRLTSDPWGTFVTTTFMWQIAHASNGYVYIAFNRDVRMALKSLIWSVLGPCGLVEPDEQKRVNALAKAEATGITAASMVGEQRMQSAKTRVHRLNIESHY